MRQLNDIQSQGRLFQEWIEPEISCKKGLTMGHKGVSKRKPRKDRSLSNDNFNNSSNTRPGEGLSVQSLMKIKGGSLNKSDVNPPPDRIKRAEKGNNHPDNGMNGCLSI